MTTKFGVLYFFFFAGLLVWIVGKGIYRNDTQAARRTPKMYA